MNYYAQGGQAHGIKALAQELPKYGRGGDSIVAHINPQEAEMLKSMGGSGTINPTTGLPEFGFFKSVSNAVAAPFRAANEVVKAVPIIGPAIDRGLVGLDKTVGKTILQKRQNFVKFTRSSFSCCIWYFINYCV